MNLEPDLRDHPVVTEAVARHRDRCRTAEKPGDFDTARKALLRDLKDFHGEF